MEIIYRHTGVFGIEVSRDGMHWRRPVKGVMREIHPFRRRHENGRQQSCYLMVLSDGRNHYITANNLVARAWKQGYEDGDYIVHKDGDLHNLDADNLQICGKKEYYAHNLRNTRNTVSLEDRIKKLEIVREETEATLDLFRNNRWEKVNRHVERYLVGCLMDYGTRTIHLGKRTVAEQVPEIVARLYECLDRGYCVYNYERWCKRMLLEYKKHGSFGSKANVPTVNIREIVPKAKIEELCEHFNVKQK